MTGLKDTLARIAQLRAHFEKLKAATPPAEPAEAQIAVERRLVEVTDFASNPGKLRMLSYVPANAGKSPALVVALHGCMQSATAYDHGSGWSELAELHGFALLMPEQLPGNNANRCFNWFVGPHTQRESGEALSIRQMIAAMTDKHGIDPGRIFVVGLSAGGAMASAMLATYPEMFSGGAIIAGLPYGAALSMGEAFDSMARGRTRPSQQWGELVRAASPSGGPWPRISIWHGAADTIVSPVNAEESLKQWTDVHGLPHQPHVDQLSANGHRLRVWRDDSGRAVIESVTIAGLSHGVPVALNTAAPVIGKPAPFHFDVGISSTLEIAKFWGLVEGNSKSWSEPSALAGTRATAQPGPAAQPLPLAAFSAIPDRWKLPFGGPRPELPGDGLARAAGPLGIIAASLKQAGVIDTDGKAKPANDTSRFDPRSVITATLRSVGLLKD